MEIRKMLSGAGSYLQGENILPQLGAELRRRQFRHAFLIAGERAWTVTREGLETGLRENGISFRMKRFSGFCTEEEACAFSAAVREAACDCLVGIGGGKALDLTKEVGAQLGLPVFTVPTCAATCAAFAPLSVLYDSEGRMVRNHHHPDEVQGVIVDTAVLAAAPPRYLASGMADAMAKSCEYSFLRSELRYGDLELSKYLGYRLALVSDEVLQRIGRQALEDNRNAQVTDAFEDAVFCTIAATGIISGMGGFVRPGGSRFAVAHSFNEILRGTYVDTRAWLHGELVGVGILAQHYTNGSPWEQIRRIERFYRDLSLPVCLSDLGLTLDDQAFSVFTEEIVHQSKVPAAQADRVRLAVAKVR